MLGYLDPGSASVAVSVVAGGMAGAVVAVKSGFGRLRRRKPAASGSGSDVDRGGTGGEVTEGSGDPEGAVDASRSATETPEPTSGG